ncbi:DUF2339 domain-containing protein [uncultured Pseudacidovorax sp.]|uniref:DUF2339 domain-containing protein n=1 Tax=uncultured Pseudacidovorax sp. TaxID=679313 RepID=UPI0025D9B852|nr:DUF2339 domain-containing protein [uncultured Pseudacidovorax sp.]
MPKPLANLVFGGNALVKLGVLILFLGLAFLLRYTAEHVSVPVELRYAGVGLAGTCLLVGGWLLRLRRQTYALTLQGAGIGVLYLTTLAAMKLSGLLPPAPGLGFLFAVAVLSAVLAVLQNAPVLAIVAALEGFVAPVLSSTGSSQPAPLCAYLLVLDLGIFAIAHFKAWRVLNLIGFVGTFTLASGWAHRNYSDADYGVTQLFLVVFFLLFAFIGLLFARRTLHDMPAEDSAPFVQRAGDTLRRVGRVDSALTFGLPMAAFGLQYAMVRDAAFGPAFAALGFAAFYLAMARLVLSTQPRGLALLAEAYAIVGVMFINLAIPLGLESRWSGATWAVEASGMYWLGRRQGRVYARLFAFLVLGGATVQLLRDTGIANASQTAVLQGSLIGPLLVAAGALFMWRALRRAALPDGWEARFGSALPWVGVAALTMLPWQWLSPRWAASATGLMAVGVFAVAQRFGLRPLLPIVRALQALAVLASLATVQWGPPEAAALAGGWQGMLAAVLVAAGLLLPALWPDPSQPPGGFAGAAPARKPAQVAAVLAGVALLHLAMLFGMDWRHAALIWPFTALLVMHLALRRDHPAMAAMAAGIYALAALLFFGSSDAASAAQAEEGLRAFAHLGFWTPLALGLAALVAGDWLRSAAHRVEAAQRFDPKRPVPHTAVANAWTATPFVQWPAPLAAPAGWLLAVDGEILRLLAVHGQDAYRASATVGVTLLTAALAAWIALRRDWRQLGLTTLATLPALLVSAAMAVGHSHGLDSPYHPFAALGWLAWPLALLWHLRLLRLQRRWREAPDLARWHLAGAWFFLLLATREGQWQLGRLSGLPDGLDGWSLLGWVLVPAAVLWALCAPRLARVWPLNEQRRTYVEVTLPPVAAGLLAWVWITSVASPGNATPLPFVPLLNPLELGQWFVLLALLRWWQALPDGSAVRVPRRTLQAGAALTGLALLTGMALRACHHYAGVEWRLDALYASWLAQATLSILWALLGVLSMVVANRRGRRSLWIGGAALLGLVVVKLFFLELANHGGLFRIVSFIGVGALLLLVGYFAPVPATREPIKDGMATP